MPDLNDDQFDAMLREHLSRELDGQLGRAGAALHRPQRRYTPRFAAWGALAAAAVLAVVLLRPRQPVLAPVQPSAAVAAAATAVEYQIDSQSIDQGTIFLDNDTPARRYVQRRIETARWIDPLTHAQMEFSVPHDEVLLVGLNSY
jgi:hypothetical protein